MFCPSCPLHCLIPSHCQFGSCAQCIYGFWKFHPGLWIPCSLVSFLAATSQDAGVRMEPSCIVRTFCDLAPEMCISSFGHPIIPAGRVCHSLLAESWSYHWADFSGLGAVWLLRVSMSPVLGCNFFLIYIFFILLGTVYL